MSENQTPAAPVEKDIQNDVTRPKACTKTGRIWEIADTMSAQEGVPVARKKVLEAAMDEGINAATAATQYGRWRRYHGLRAEAAPDAEVGEASDVSTEADAE